MTGAAIAKARAAWGTDAPEWVRVLAEECDKTSQASVAKKLGNSSTVVSRILTKSYPGNVEKIAAKVRGVFLSEEVTCPVLGVIPRQRCIAEQDRRLTFTNPDRKRVYDACRAGCPNSRLGDGK